MASRKSRVKTKSPVAQFPAQLEESSTPISVMAQARKVKQPPILFEKTQQVVHKVSAELGGTFIAYWTNRNGSVCHNDVVALYSLLERIGPQSTIYLYVKSDGGNGQASLRIINLIRQYTSNLIALVPLECASAATMIVLGANRILMGPMAYLTAVDTSLTHNLSPVDRDNDRVSVSLDELTRVIRLWRGEPTDAKENAYKVLYQYVHPLVIGAVDRAESLSLMLCKELLTNHIKDPALVDDIAETLNAKYPSHSYPILLEEARKLRLPADRMSPAVHTLLLELSEFYSEMGQKATTDFDEFRSHSNEILNIWESNGYQVYFQQDKDWFYRREERRWITMNDDSSWRRVEHADDKVKKSILHIS